MIPNQLNSGMDSTPSPQGTQTATGRDDLHRETPPSNPAASRDGSLSCPAVHRSAADENSAQQLEHAIAQAKRRRDEALSYEFRQRQSRAFADGVFARHDVMCRIYKSQPLWLRASPSILGKTWWRVHHKVATVALLQAHRAVRRLGLTRVPDTKDFVEQHCSWYVSFCAFSNWLFPQKDFRQHLGSDHAE